MANEKILIADDDKNICELLRLYLAKEGYETVIANDGEAAVAAFEKEKPNIVLLDVMMPNMDGLDATRAIRALDRADAKVIPIIAMTANAFEEDKQNALNAGMNGHIAKPLDIPHLLKVLEEALK